MLGSVHESDSDAESGSVSGLDQVPRYLLPDQAGSGRPLAFEPGDEDGWHRIARGYRLAGLLLSAHRMGLLRALAGRGQLTVDQLSQELLADARLLTVICRALRSAGLLLAGDDGWQLTPAGERLATDPGASLELDAMAEDYRRWGELDRHARTLWDEDRTESRNYDDADIADNEQAARRYARRLTNRRSQQVDRLLARVEPTRPLVALDAWGGDGYVARAMCARWPQITCTVMEIPTMARVARDACAGQPRIAVIAGDLLHDDPGIVLAGETVDVVVLSHVLQSLSQQRRRELMAQVTHVLAPGGCLLSNEYVLRWNDQDSLDVLLWAVGRTSANWHGQTLRAADQDMLLRGGGLAAVGAWWVTESTRAVLGVKTAAGIEPALRTLPESQAATRG
jgi:SAM-dependent methyltransferase